MKPEQVNKAAIATFVVFAINGLAFASWAARIPAVTRVLGLNPGEMGAVLLTGAAGSVLALPVAGTIVGRIGTASTSRLGGSLAAIGALVISMALLVTSVPIIVVGLFLFGVGIGLWDVSQNIEGAEVERHLGRTVMPRFHAGFSGGAFVGALLGAGMSSLNLSLSLHLTVIAVFVTVVLLVATRYYLPERDLHTGHAEGVRLDTPARVKPAPSAWRELRTVLVGLVVLGAALTEGAANDWIAKATVDGLHSSESVGAVMFAAFVASMTIFRFIGGRYIDRFGRVPVLYASLGAALVGLVVFVFGPNIWIAGLGAILWGAGAALGFPMGMSAAADDPQRAAARVSVVSTIGYVAFLAGPPLLGFLGDHLTIRVALLAVGAAIVASLLTAPAAKPLPAVRAELGGLSSGGSM
ncbi:MFS transporter [Paenarthrobacter sp. PH39-S1]|uniref:MFS transporter n=1 Tax=Paenarthrobacter sp. PH39-S1 TaxID=3046204 RepID=UPI0024B8B8D2|nr:MFS transporter [Paenarthrobacter sp. PH39-S1]MDJ0355806.1 MFS transporter [Paenarthrobacter sp. PH39-S1]